MSNRNIIQNYRYRNDEKFRSTQLRASHNWYAKFRSRFWPNTMPLEQIRLVNGIYQDLDASWFLDPDRIDLGVFRKNGKGMILHRILDSKLNHIGYVNYIPGNIKVLCYGLEGKVN